MSLEQICERKEWDFDFMQEVLSTTMVRGINFYRAPLFEETMKKLSSVGFKNIWILDTGQERWGKYKGPCEKLIYLNPKDCRTAMIAFQKIQLPDNIERILMLDHDVFIFDPVDALEYVYVFARDNYDFVSLSGGEYPQSDKENNIIIPKDLREFAPYCWPSGIAYCIFKRDFWDKIPLEEFFFTIRNAKAQGIDLKKRFPHLEKLPDIKKPGTANLWWTQIAELEPKFGVHRMEKRESISEFILKYGGTHIENYFQYEVGRWLHFQQMSDRCAACDSRARNPKAGLLFDIHKGYFCKYFPDKVGFIPASQHKKYLAIWNKFLRMIQER